MLRQNKGVTEKRCSKCQDWKPIDDFGLRADLPDGHQTYCKECVRITNRERAARQPRVWKSTEEWLTDYTSKYIRQHPLDKWMLDKLKGTDSSWEEQAYKAAIKEINNG